MEQNTRPGDERGFTLIELLVVASILVVLAGLGLVQYKNGVTRSREAVLKTDLFNLRDAIDQFYADKGQYPGTLDELVSSGYLRRVPRSGWACGCSRSARSAARRGGSGARTAWSRTNPSARSAATC